VQHGIGQKTAGDTFNGKRVSPVESAGQQTEGCGSEDDPHGQAGKASPGRAGGALAHPANTDAADDDGEKEGRDADGLQQQVGEPRTCEASPVVRSGATAGDGIGRRVTGRVAGDGEQQQHGAGDDYKAQDLVESAIAGWRRNEPEWFHEGAQSRIGRAKSHASRKRLAALRAQSPDRQS